MQLVKSVEIAALRIAYVEHGSTSGWPVILSHGFPYDVHAFKEVASILVRAGARVVAPYTRWFGLTRFVSDIVMRSGQQAPHPFADAVIKVRDWFLLEKHTDDGFRRR